MLAERWKSIVHSITVNDPVCVFFDKDPDGISSGVIVAKTIERTRHKKVEHFFAQSTRDDPLNEEFLEHLELLGVRYFISVDSSLEKYKEQLERIAQFATVVVFDHHKIYNTINNNKITIIKSQYINPDIDGSQYCTAKLTYDLCSPIADIEDLDWLECVGILADSNYKTYKSHVESVFKKYSITHNGEVFNTPIGRIASLISYAESDPNYEIVDAFDIVYNATSPQDILSSELSEFEHVSHELHRIMNEHKEKAEFIGDAIIYHIQPKYRIGSTAATILSHKFYPDKTFIMITDMNTEKLHISGRRQDGKIAMNTLLENATQGCSDATAGGHSPASGATISKKDLDIFLSQLKEQLLTLKTA